MHNKKKYNIQNKNLKGFYLNGDNKTFRFWVKRIFLLLNLFFLLPHIGLSANCNSKEFDKYINKLQNYIHSNDLVASITYSDSILYEIKKNDLNDCEQTYWFLLAKGEVLELSKKFEGAIENYQKIIKISEEKKWWKLNAQAYISLGRTYEYLSLPKDELRYLKKALQVISINKLDSIYARYCTRYSSYHRLFGSQDSAKIYAIKSIKLGKKYNVIRSVYDGYLLRGILASQPDTSIYYFKKATHLYLIKGDSVRAAQQTINIAGNLLNNRKYSDALKYLNQAQNYLIHPKSKNKFYYYVLSNLYEKKSIAYEESGNIDSAYYFLKLFKKNTEKAEWYANNEKVKLITFDFEIEKEKDRRKYLEKLSTVMMWGLIVMSLVGVFLIFLFYKHLKGIREIKKQSKTIHLQKEKLEELLNKQTILLSEVHHRVKNNLQLVISLLFLKSKNSRSTKFKNYLDDIAMKVYSISLIHEQLYSSNDFDKINIKLYFEKMVNYFKELEKNKELIDIDLNIEEICLNLETIMPLGLISSELISNSLKYARTSDKILKLNINIYKLDNKYVFKYSDNGPGIADIEKMDKISKMGLKLIKSLV
ncbi:MAG TPA: hypothetical protein ENK91_14735, partial [Bacteroidetes bacterium]|nr:hypothetical protein [Bacteroidota bacterium]